MLPSHRSDSAEEDFSHVLLQHASALYDDQRLNPMLKQLIRTSCRLGNAMGGSVSLVDGVLGSYTKVAEIGTACRLGQSFPLSEGVTGEVLRRRSPVVLRTYRDLRSGHLKAGHPAADGAVVAIPVWWRADIVAVNVVFAGVSRAFSAGEVDHLELVTQVVASGLVSAVERERPSRSARPGAVVVDAAAVNAERALDSVANVVTGLIELTHRASSDPSAPTTGLEVRVVGNADQPRLLFRSEHERGADGLSPDSSWHELVDTVDGVIAVSALQSGPHSGPGSSADAGDHDRPFSSREREVATLLSQGLSDRAIATQLILSPKTVEKHVSAVLRKTGTTSRTAAVVRCLDLGWV